nr:translation initiation factor IF-2-like [Aegilops tauschii subsp. strangulata]
MEEEEANLGAGGSAPATNAGGEGATSSQPGADPSSADQEDVDTVIEEVAKDAEDEANKISAEEVAKTAAEEAAKGTAGEAGKTAAKEASKGPTREAGKEEDLAAHEEALAASLCGKDEEVEKLAAQRTQELEQRHKEALNAQALVHASKVKELEVERDGLKRQVL